MPDIIPPGGEIVAAGKFAIFYLVVLFLEQRVHLPVAIQQPIQPPGIHPDVNFRGGSTFHQVDDDILIVRAAGLAAQSETGNVRAAQGKELPG